MDWHAELPTLRYWHAWIHYCHMSSWELYFFIPKDFLLVLLVSIPPL